MTTENKTKNIYIYPELAAKVLQNNESEIFIIWSILKTLDTKGTGVVLMSDILEICKNVFGLNPTYAYSKINKGIDKFWRKPKGSKGNKVIGLFSFKSICQRLQPDLTRCHPIVVPLGYFISGTSDCKFFKNFLIGCVAGRYVDGRPLSIATIALNCGLSESTTRNAIKSCSFLTTKPKYKIIKTDICKTKLQIIKSLSKSGIKYRIVQGEDGYMLVEQMPNSYSISEFERLPLRVRPDVLKKFKNENLVPARYISEDGRWQNNDKSDILNFRVII
jgi:hypothetical protein